MSRFSDALAPFNAWRWTRRNIAWIGGLFIASIIATGAWDIHRSYHQTVDEIGRDLDTQARVLAEQTARSIQSVDLVLRNLERQYYQGLLPMERSRLRAHLREQAVGLVQIDGLLFIKPDGSIAGTSYLTEEQEKKLSVVGQVGYDMARTTRFTGLFIDTARRSAVDDSWMFPMLRRLNTPSGALAGSLGARGRIDYFQQFYQNVRVEPGLKVTLMHQNGYLIARDPPVEAVLGQRLPSFDELLASYHSRERLPWRVTSPIDGAERFAAMQLVPDYPLAVVVTKDVDVALAPWRAHWTGTVARNLALALVAVLLLVALIRQLSRVYLTRESLAASEERFALAVAGSNDGILDWDIVHDRMFASERAKRIVGATLEGTVFSRAEWMLQLKIHPDDRVRHDEDLRRNLDGETLIRQGEYRLLHPDGQYRWVLVRGTCVRDELGKAIRWAGSVSDIDARKRAEEGLRASEERFALAVEASDSGIVDCDLLNDRMYSSERAMQILGVQSQVTLRTCVEWQSLVRIHPEDRQLHDRNLHDYLRGVGDAREGEFRVLQPDGRYRWVHMRASCVRDASGMPIRWAGSVSDIDDRKRAEEALRQSEQRFALAVIGSDDGIWHQDYVTRQVFVSSRARELAGLPPQPEHLPMDEWFATMDAQIHPDDAPLRDAAMRDHMARKTPSFESEHRERQPDGSYRWVRVRGVCVFDEQGNPLRMAGSASDIDTAKRAAESLRESEERFALAVAGSNDGIVDWDLVHDRMYSSERAMQIVGIHGEAARVTVRPRAEWRDLVKYHPDDLPRMKQDLQDFLDGRTELRDGEYRVLHPDGEYRWMRHRNRCVRDAQGRPLRVAGSVSDIDAQKRAELERIRLESQLLQAKKLEAIGTLAGGIAHDFNNILAAILGYGEMARGHAREGTALRRHVEAVVSAGMRAKSLVERILAFSRSGIGERKPVHVQAVVMEALDLVAASLPATVSIERQLQSGEAAVMGDPTQIHQVVMNLCTNAAHAMKIQGTPQGTISVALDVVQKQRTLLATSTLEAGRYVRLKVGDTGTGIAPQVLERLFDPFFTTKDVGVGTGLGLSLVHGIVTDLGGGIEVDSQPGQGTAFTVYLPQSDEAAVAADIEESAPLGQGETVLLVDDEEPLVRLGEEMIAELGYEPVGFTSSTAALEAFRADPSRFSAVLSDESMPDMTGLELAAMLRAIRPNLPIVIMSGFVTPALSARARELGVAEVRVKPLVSREIAKSLAYALRRDTETPSPKSGQETVA